MALPPVAVLPSVWLSTNFEWWEAHVAGPANYVFLAAGLVGLWLLPARRWVLVLLTPVYLVAAWGLLVLIVITFGCLLFGSCL